MFGRKKTPAGRNPAPLPRGRDREGQSGQPNPLARRFRADDEPATVDLDDPARFHARVEQEKDPLTKLQATAARLGRVISQDPETGKFYLHPGTAESPVLLGGRVVVAPTELRPGDVIRVGEAEFRFGPGD